MWYHAERFCVSISLHCVYYLLTPVVVNSKNLGRPWLAYTESQGDFTCDN